MEEIFQDCVGLFSSKEPRTEGLIELSGAERDELEALYLQVTKGPCPTSQPKAEGKEKQVWSQWKKLDQLSKEKCMEKYIDIIASSISSQSKLQSYIADSLDKEKAKKQVQIAQRILNFGKNPSLSVSLYEFTEDLEMIDKISPKWSDDENEQLLYDVEMKKTALSPQDTKELSDTLISAINYQIEDLSKLSNNTLTRVETLEKIVGQFRTELEEREKQRRRELMIIFMITAPCLLFTVWSLVKKIR